MNCRCSHCGKRRTLTRREEAKGLAGPKCPACKIALWRVDRYRMRVEKKVKPCYCGSYAFPHRRKSGICMHNPNLTEEDFENMVASMRIRKTHNMG